MKWWKVDPKVYVLARERTNSSEYQRTNQDSSGTTYQRSVDRTVTEQLRRHEPSEYFEQRQHTFNISSDSRRSDRNWATVSRYGCYVSQKEMK